MSGVLLKWFWAVRPLTLIASVAPVLMGTAMAFGFGVGHGPSACLAFLGAVLIQIGTNLANDYFDAKKGADSIDRIGPPRTIPSGILSAQHVKWGFIIAFALAGFVSSFLIARAGWPILLVAIISILSGILYTAGPRSLAYMGLGDVFVLIFFGPVAVAGTYYVQSFEINPVVVLAGFAPGFLSLGILAINNLRDARTDAMVDKKTLAVRFGRTFVRYEYLFCILAASAVPVAVFAMMDSNPEILFSSGIAFLFIPTIHDVLSSDDGKVLNLALERTGKLLFIFTIIYCLAWLI